MLQMAFLVLFAFVGSSGKELSYEAAYAKADKENKPLLVLVGADWCAACKTMKSTTLERMKEAGDFKEVVVAFVDKDARPIWLPESCRESLCRSSSSSLKTRMVGNVSRSQDCRVRGVYES